MRIMVFIDGSNYLTQLASFLGGSIQSDKPDGSFLMHAAEMLRRYDDYFANKRKGSVIRRYWFGSYTGDECNYDQLRRILHNQYFEPMLFKIRNKKEKGVDIALAKEMLVNAFNQNYDLGLLIAGDADYVGLVNEVKRYGQIIFGRFFENGLSGDLVLACDQFTTIKDDADNEDRRTYKKLRGILSKSGKEIT